MSKPQKVIGCRRNMLIMCARRQWKRAYEIAIEKLSVEERSRIDSDMVSSCNLYSVLDAASKTLAERDENKWRYTKLNGEVVILRERFDKIIEGFTKYADCISIAIQHQPEVTSLVWAAARFLIQVYIPCRMVSSVSHSISFYLILDLSRPQGRYRNAGRSAQNDRGVDGEL
jgi:hypothetical protein